MSCVPVAHLPRVSVAIALLKYLYSPNGVTEMFGVRGVAFACSAAYLVHPSRTLYVVFPDLGKYRLWSQYRGPFTDHCHVVRSSLSRHQSGRRTHAGAFQGYDDDGFLLAIYSYVSQ